METDPNERWMSYTALADLLGIKPASARMLARRKKWLRRSSPNDPGTVQILVPLEIAAKNSPKRPPKPVVPPAVPPDVAQGVAALQAALERADGDRRVLQQQADALRDKLAEAQLATAAAAAGGRLAEARASAAEKHVADLQRLVEDLRRQVSRLPWWRWW